MCSYGPFQARLPDRGASLVKELKYEQPFGSDFYLTTDFGAPEWLAKDIIQIFCDGDYEAAPLMSNRHYAAFREKYFPSGEVGRASLAACITAPPVDKPRGMCMMGGMADDDLQHSDCCMPLPARCFTRWRSGCCAPSPSSRRR